MKGFTLTILLALLLAIPAGAQFNPAPLYEYAATYTAWSDVSDGVYWWSVRNERTDATMTGWTTGAAYPIGTIPGAAIIPEAHFPLPVVSPTLPRPWFNAFLTSLASPVVVLSTMRWSDGSFAVAPVWMPSDAPLLALQPVPEPSGLLALTVGLAGMVGAAWKRRKT